ncbi:MULTISPECIES: PAS domain-containing sensor histidine kinase [Halorubrum]|uniref:histidine kinase n=1 Tax=Halorubrum hochstenium ATCC 700873 TaxID=1227481 RepID=M0EY91_9EURY|nr:MULTISPECIES: ATP-binding protein [Halorubrum]ELZ52690.1 signal-transducing histidine kinase [Halorubrum hochstenium ATCC 700873]
MSRDEGGETADHDDRYRHLIEHVQDAVVEFELVEEDPVVRDVKDSFVEVFGYGADEIRGEPLNEWVVPEWRLEEARELDANTRAGEVNYRNVTRETATGLREFLYRGVPYDGDGSASGGFAVYTDLTEVARNERRLKVLNRVLRHNIRNNANVVAGHTTRLLNELDRQDSTTTDVAATIERAARELERLAEEAGHIRHVLNRGLDGSAETDPASVVRSVADEHRGRSPAAEIELDLAASGPVIADHRLRHAVDALVDNAIAHNPSSTPRVRIRVERGDGDSGSESDGGRSGEWLVVHVEDDGPRIPPDERSVIRDDAEITQTRHGSGLGL